MRRRAENAMRPVDISNGSGIQAPSKSPQRKPNQHDGRRLDRPSRRKWSRVWYSSYVPGSIAAVRHALRNKNGSHFKDGECRNKRGRRRMRNSRNPPMRRATSPPNLAVLARRGASAGYCCFRAALFRVRYGRLHPLECSPCLIGAPHVGRLQ